MPQSMNSLCVVGPCPPQAVCPRLKHTLLRLLILRKLVAVSDITMAPPVLHPHKKVNLPYTGGTTPLHLAASRNQINCVRLLMWEGADYNAVNAKLETSLFLSAAQGFKECVLTQLRNAISLPILSIPTITDGEQSCLFCLLSLTPPPPLSLSHSLFVSPTCLCMHFQAYVYIIFVYHIVYVDNKPFDSFSLSLLLSFSCVCAVEPR